MLDSSLLVAALVREEHTDFAAACLEDHLLDGYAAPGLLRWEFANVLLKKARKGLISEPGALVLSQAFEQLNIRFPTPGEEPTVATLASLARTHGLTVYDAAFLDLAMDQGWPLATLDEDLSIAARMVGVAVHSIF